MAERLAKLNKGDIEVYSTNKVQVGVWTNGKPIYRKILSGTISAYNSIAYLPTSENIDDVIAQSWMLKLGSAYMTLPSFNDAMTGKVSGTVLNATATSHPNTYYAYATANASGFVGSSFVLTLDFTEV
jgi:hypothetical protein